MSKLKKSNQVVIIYIKVFRSMLMLFYLQTVKKNQKKI